MLTSLPSRLKKAARWLPMTLLPLAVHAQAPANDNPSGATPLPLAATCTPVSTTNTGATTTVVTGLGYTNPGCGIAASPKDVWYTFTTNATGQGSTAVTITVAGTVAGQVRVFSSTGGAAGPFTSVGCSAGTTNNTQAPALDLRGLTPSTTYYVDVSGYGSADTQGAFTICATILNLPANDVAVTAIYSYGQVAQTPNSPHVVRAVVSNLSLGALTNVSVTLTVSGANTFTTTQTVASLASNGTATVTFPGYPLTNLGVNTLTVTVPTDDVTSNNSKTFTQSVTAGRLAYIDGTQPLNATGVGVGAAGGILAARYTLAQAGVVSSITPTFVGAGTANTTYQVQLYDATGTGGTPGAVLFTSGTQTRPGATGSPAVAIPNIAIPAGDFFVAIKELNNNVGLGYQVEDPLRTNTFYYQVPAGAWTSVNTTSLRTRLALEVGLGAVACASVTNLAAANITTTTASLTFTGPANGTTYTITYTPTGGATTTVTPAPTASPVALTGLTPGTTYAVSVTTNCGAGQTSTAATITFTTPALAPANDNCAAAVALPINGATCTNTLGTTAGATASSAPVPAPSCGGPALGPLADVWYSVTVPANGAVTVTTSAATGSPLTDTVIELYSGTCGALTSVGCNDDNAAGSFSTLVLTGQTAGATLYVRVRVYNTTPNGQFNICATTTAPAPPTPFVTPPYTESFEGPWVSVQSVREAPTNNWRNTPLTGDNSWRREDDGFASAGWRFLGDETGATPPYVIRSSVGAHSARFHSFAAAVGLQGKLDLYANLSGNGNKTLSFDYINPTGTDKMDVLVSTDGGTTFGATPVLTATTNAAFTPKTVVIPGNSATTVIRFQATADFGNDDIGIDNLRLSVLTSTRNEALAATLSLYPNPAHRSFTLGVPAGSLRAASAKLINALGQVVQMRQLNLPAAGGTADFDVSNLAPGVYSLQLKSGDDTVVKRVVVE